MLFFLGIKEFKTIVKMVLIVKLAVHLLSRMVIKTRLLSNCWQFNKIWSF